MGRHSADDVPDPASEADDAPAPELHVEMFWATRGGEPILIRCDCEIGRTHTYAEWVERFQLPVYSFAELSKATS